MTAEVCCLLKTRDEAFSSPQKSKNQSVLWHQKCETIICSKKSMITSQTAETNGAYGKPFRPSLTKAPATGLWWQNIPPRYPQPLLLTVWNAEWHACTKLPTSPNDKGLCLSPADVRKTLSRINPRKAAGSNNIPGRVLKDCAEQLTDVPTDIFNTSLSHAVIPTCLKSTTIIPKRNHMCPV